MKIVSFKPENYVPFTQSMIADISLALMNLGVSNECQYCRDGRTQIANGATITILQNRVPVNMIVGETVICAMTICDHCGHKEEYDLSRLGLLDKFMPFFEKVLEQDKEQGEVSQ